MSNKVAIVTGGSSGIGLAAVKAFLRENVRAAIVGRRKETELPEFFRKLLRDNDDKIIYLQGNVAHAADCRNVAEKVLLCWGRIDILVNSAGQYMEKLFCDTTEEDYENIMAVNVKGTYFMSQSVIAPMRRVGGGAIVNISSDAGLQGNLQCTLYCATKGAVNTFTKALAIEVAPYNIRVNAVCPGDIASASDLCGTQDVFDTQKHMHYPLGRIGQAEEVAEVIAFLCSDKASFVTGALWSVDGGLTA